MELGLHIGDFTWAGGAAELGPRLARHVRQAEAVGFTRITVMDHFWQIRGVGPTEAAMLEAYTTLGFLVAHTDTVRLHALVSGVVFREPALLAKQVATLDLLSGGRVGLGIGAAWNEEESVGLGFPFPAIPERFARLEETIRICLQLWSDSEQPFNGEHYRLARTLSEPPTLARPRPPLMIGGGGERRTLRLVAQYADACNISELADPARKLEVLRAHCDATGRNYDEIEKTTLIAIDPDTTTDDVVRRAAGLRELGFTAVYVIASGIAEPDRIIDTLGTAIPQLAD
jgi:alkanesulfonate monooxygenase